MQNNLIFDRIMQLPVLKPFEPFYTKHREVLLYLFFGGLAFLVSIATFSLFHLLLHIGELTANALSWFITVLFAYLTNRIWVFQAPVHTAKELIWQIASFWGGRVLTLILEEIILFVFITWCGFPSMAVKICAQVIVIAANYIISKLLVFAHK